jgi:hypothetical protein
MIDTTTLVSPLRKREWSLPKIANTLNGYAALYSHLSLLSTDFGLEGRAQ